MKTFLSILIVTVLVGIGVYAIATGQTLDIWFTEQAIEVDKTFDEKSGYQQVKNTGTYQVDVYESPQGFGYQIISIQGGNTVSKGYGPESESRTYTLIKQAEVATSTPL